MPILLLWAVLLLAHIIVLLALMNKDLLVDFEAILELTLFKTSHLRSKNSKNLSKLRPYLSFNVNSNCFHVSRSNFSIIIYNKISFEMVSLSNCKTFILLIIFPNYLINCEALYLSLASSHKDLDYFFATINNDSFIFISLF